MLTINLVKVFDLLYLNGRSLIHKSCKFRKRNLRTCFTEKQGRIEFVTEYQGKTAKDVRDRMEVVMDARGEGLILKHPDGEYVLNGRNKDWIKVRWDTSCFLDPQLTPPLKVKPEYMVSFTASCGLERKLTIYRTTWGRLWMSSY